jgi:4-amino-4-deoxy-L-arabinose transferase-like glycosyltransferase
MADIRRFGPADFLLLLLVLATAAGARVVYLTSCADGGRSDGPLRVQDARPPLANFTAPEDMRGAPAPSDLDVLIHHVRERGWFGCQAPFAPAEEATAHTSPGYPWLVGLLGRFVAEARLDSMVRWGQVGLGTLTAMLYFFFARRAFRSLLVGTLAGLFAALHPFWIIDTATIDDGTLCTFALAACLFLGGQAGEKGGAFASLLFGLALAGLALVRAAMLPFSFVAVVWFLLRSRTLPRGWLCALLAFLGFANGLAPWTVRNIQLFKEPVPIVSSAYLHLWVGNNPQATGGPATEQTWQSAPVDEMKAIPNQPARYALLGKEVSREIREDPANTLRRRMMAALMFFVGDRWLKDGTLAEVTPSGAENMPEWLKDAYPTTLQAVLLAMLGLSILGWRWTYGWRWESVIAVLAMLWVPIPYILGHAEGLSGPRLPLDGVLLCYAAFALCCLIPGINGPLLDPPEEGPKEEKR